MTMAVIGKARICGLIIDRRELGDVGSFSGYTDKQLMQEATSRARRLGIAAIGRGRQQEVALGRGGSSRPVCPACWKTRRKGTHDLRSVLLGVLDADND